jgi:transcriptional regulator with XRE-family HTH domain
MDLKERVFQARKAKGFSQEDLAEMIGVSRQAVSKWETGETMPDIEKLIALCNALDLNMEYLALGKESVPSEKISPRPKLWIAVLLAVAFLMAGFLMGRFLPRQIADAMVEIRISNATVTGTPGGNLEVAILPATLPEGLEIELLCEDKLLNKTETVTCVSDGNYYRATLSRPEKFRWCVTAVLIYKGNKTQILLWEIDGDGSVFSATHLWETAQ